MPKSPPDPKSTEGYLQWSKDPAMGVFAVLPLWLCYEALRLGLGSDERNGAEVLISEVLRLLGPTAFAILRVVLGLAVLAAAFSIWRRRMPWLRVTLATALEGSIYALILGPLASLLEASSARLLQAPLHRTASGERGFFDDLASALGAGIFEELVFRLVLLSVLALLLMRSASAFGLPRALGVATALVLSSVLFSLFHHVGPGADAFTQRVFVFRAMAGCVLGALFIARGFGVCVYAHALYDLHYYLTT